MSNVKAQSSNQAQNPNDSRKEKVSITSDGVTDTLFFIADRREF
jgi:hypothetical protein